MILWHLLSLSRLQQKLDYAKTHQNTLYMSIPEPQQDISQGQLGSYLYCLSTLAGGIPFFTSEDEPLKAIHIDLAPEVRIFHFRGDPDQIDYSKVKMSFDVIDMTIDSKPKWPIKFRQFLILSQNAIQNWIYNEELVTATFLKEFKALCRGELSSENFFMSDFSQEEQIIHATLLAKRLSIRLPF